MVTEPVNRAAEALRELLHERPRLDAGDVYPLLYDLATIVRRCCDVLDHCGVPSTVAVDTDDHLTLYEYDIEWVLQREAFASAVHDAARALDRLHEFASHLVAGNRRAAVG